MKKNRMITLVMITGLSVVMVWLLIAQLQPAQAATAIRYVAADGNDSWSCENIPHRCQTVQRAINIASPLDEIRVASGLYTSASGTVISVTKTVNLLGGWNAGFTVRNPDTYLTRLDGGRINHVVHIDGSISPTIDGFVITGGKSPKGGGVYVRGAAAIIQNNVITDNLTTDAGTYYGGQGGGIYVEGATDAVIQGNLIISNTSGYGGGIYHIGPTSITITANTVTSNHGTKRGGGMMIEYSPDVIQANVISDNATGGDGGGMMIWAAAPRVEANLIMNNQAVAGGGISLGNGATPSLYNNMLINNTKDGISVGSSSPVLVNNTIVGSGQVDAGRGIRLASGSDCEPPYCSTGKYINNVITKHEVGIYGSGVITPEIDYNDVWGNSTANYQLPIGVVIGSHNLSVNPLFVNVAGGDYHLQATSPCVDKGDPAGVPPAPPLDIDSDRRPYGSRVDIGADEYAVYLYLYLPLVARP